MVGSSASGHDTSPPGHHRRRPPEPSPGRGRSSLRGVRGLGQQAPSPLPRQGEAAFEPRSRRPKTTPGALPGGTVDLIARLRKELTEQGLDAGRGHHRLAPAPPPRPHRVAGQHQPVPARRRAGRPGTQQAPEVVLHPVPGRAAQPVLAVRLHPMGGPARWDGGPLVIGGWPLRFHPALVVQGGCRAAGRCPLA